MSVLCVCSVCTVCVACGVSCGVWRVACGVWRVACGVCVCGVWRRVHGVQKNRIFTWTKRRKSLHDSHFITNPNDVHHHRRVMFSSPECSPLCVMAHTAKVQKSVAQKNQRRKRLRTWGCWPHLGPAFQTVDCALKQMRHRHILVEIILTHAGV